jgi:hypothetical protein
MGTEPTYTKRDMDGNSPSNSDIPAAHANRNAHVYPDFYPRVEHTALFPNRHFVSAIHAGI